MPSTKKRSKRTKEAAPEESENRLRIEAMLGPTLLPALDKKPVDTTKLVPPSQTPLVALYFGANDDAACQKFVPLLKAFFETEGNHKKAKAPPLLQVVYVSSDRTVADFESAYGAMPASSINSSSLGIALVRPA